MKSTTNTTPLTSEAGLAVSDSLLHVSHLIDEWCDLNMPSIYKEESVEMLHNKWEAYDNLVAEEWDTLLEIQREAESGWEVKW